MSALITVAMELEAQPFLDALAPLDDGGALAAPAGAQAWRLSLPERAAPEHDPSAAGPGAGEVLLVRTGIGLVAAAAALAAVLTRVEPRAVIAAGTAGGLGHRVEVGDVCVSASLAFTDADATVFGYARGQVPGQPAVFQADAALVESLAEIGEPALRTHHTTRPGLRLPPVWIETCRDRSAWDVHGSHRACQCCGAVCLCLPRSGRQYGRQQGCGGRNLLQDEIPPPPAPGRTAESCGS